MSKKRRSASKLTRTEVNDQTSEVNDQTSEVDDPCSVDQLFASIISDDDQLSSAVSNGHNNGQDSDSERHELDPEQDDDANSHDPPGNDDENEDEQQDDQDDDEEEEETLEQFGQSLEKLKTSDPEFYRFLQQHDKQLLDTDLDAESDQEDVSEDVEEQETDTSYKDGDLSSAKLEKLQQDLGSPHRARQALKTLVMLFGRAVEEAVDSIKAAKPLANPAEFNQLVRVCFEHVPGAVARCLKLSQPSSSHSVPSSSPHPADSLSHGVTPSLFKHKHWAMLRSTVKHHLNNVYTLLACSGAASMQCAILRHVLSMGALAAHLPCRRLVAHSLRLWCGVGGVGQQSDSKAGRVAVLAFLVLYRVAQHSGTEQLYDSLLSRCYLTYVRACVCTDASSWPHLHMMRRCLVELYCLQPSACSAVTAAGAACTRYQRAFLYIRQLAIHLRNAKLDKQKYQTVYNWQYTHCLLFWSSLMCETSSDQIKLLMYPLVQIMLGSVALIPTLRHVPFRLHVITALTDMCVSTNVFIPVLPLIIQIWHLLKLGGGGSHKARGKNSQKQQQRGSRQSVRPIDLQCLLRFSACQLREAALPSTVLQASHSALMRYLHAEHTNIALPELLAPLLPQIKRVAAAAAASGPVATAFKQLARELQANVTLVLERRQQRVNSLQVATSGGDQWKQQLQEEGTPFSRYYDVWWQQQLRQRRQTPAPGQKKISVREEHDENDDEQHEDEPTSDQDDQQEISDDDKYDDEDELSDAFETDQPASSMEGMLHELQHEQDSVKQLTFTETRPAAVRKKRVKHGATKTAGKRLKQR